MVACARAQCRENGSGGPKASPGRVVLRFRRRDGPCWRSRGVELGGVADAGGTSSYRGSSGLNAPHGSAVAQWERPAVDGGVLRLDRKYSTRFTGERGLSAVGACKAERLSVALTNTGRDNCAARQKMFPNTIILEDVVSGSAEREGEAPPGGVDAGERSGGGQRGAQQGVIIRTRLFRLV